MDKVISKERKKNFKEKIVQNIDTNTGELISQTYEVIGYTTSGEDDYIKLYYKTMLAFNGADDVPLEFVLALSNYITWTNEGEPMKFNNIAPVKDAMCNLLKIKQSMYTNYINRCKKNGLLFATKYRGIYEVNPFFVAKGKWDSIKTLRSSFDFIEGKWERILTENVHELSNVL